MRSTWLAGLMSSFEALAGSLFGLGLYCFHCAFAEAEKSKMRVKIAKRFFMILKFWSRQSHAERVQFTQSVEGPR